MVHFQKTLRLESVARTVSTTRALRDVEEYHEKRNIFP